MVVVVLVVVVVVVIVVVVVVVVVVVFQMLSCSADQSKELHVLDSNRLPSVRAHGRAPEASPQLLYSAFLIDPAGIRENLGSNMGQHSALSDV